ncbi:MAG: GYDIA family GHMP kinase [Bdellovibrionales bacterium]
MTSQNFYAHGKLLLTSEYCVLDGAPAIALPTKLGQTLSVQTQTTNNNQLHWQAFNMDKTCWIDAIFDLETFEINQTSKQSPNILQKILQQARIQNPDFLTQPNDLNITTYLDFNKDWGLGSSSTLIHTISQWANICPFTLLNATLGGSGYDIACAHADGPILYQKQGDPLWSHTNFNPRFANQLYFIYLNKKQNSRDSINQYKSQEKPSAEILDSLNKIVSSIQKAEHLDEFEDAIKAHENLISKQIKRPTVKEKHFSDFQGTIKSLGAWGGDFILATSTQGDEETFAYFKKRGYNTILKYEDLILNNNA